jgi:hypothetical protein
MHQSMHKGSMARAASALLDEKSDLCLRGPETAFAETTKTQGCRESLR